MSIVEELTSLVQCASHYDCETLKKQLLVESDCASNMSLCEALKSAIKLDADGNIFLDIPISLRVNEIHLKGENPVVLEDTVWEDLYTPASAIKLSGGSPPTETAYKGSSVLAFPTNANKIIYFGLHMPHSWKEGSEIEFHIHWTIPTSGAGVGAENVKWDFTHSIASTGELFPAESAETTTVDVQDTLLDTHIYTDVVDIDMTGETISSVLLCSLTRDVAVASDYAASAYLCVIDFHYQRDSMGSKTEAVK